MGMLKNPRHEAFARKYVEHGIARRAYAEAGYRARQPINPRQAAPIDAAASRLLKHVKVSKRINEVRAMAAKRADITEDSIADKLERAYDLALQEKQTGAAVSAAVAQAKLAGLLVERREIGDAGEFARMTEQELREYVEGKPQAPLPTHQGTSSKQ